jgi:hypothetical protein
MSSGIGWLSSSVEKCVLRYDNKAGKGDHRHVGDAEERYQFKSAGRLLADFWADVEEMLK